MIVLHSLATPLLGDTLATSVVYRGFTFDASRAQADPATEQVETALREQVDKVYSVGLPAEILIFFQTVPIQVVPPSGFSSVEPGFYSGSEKSIKVSTALLAFRHKPVLIHELLHAYHDQKMEGGIFNPEILKFYRQAKSIGTYAARSHMMLNNREFFACSGTTYLYGVTAQEPFHREKVAAAQPELIAYYQQLFGPNAGTYMGQISP